MCLGIPGRIVEILDERDLIALADFGGVRRRVNVLCVLEGAARPHDLVGRWVLVHVGFAMSLIDEAEAQRTLALLEQMVEAEQAAEPEGGAA